MVAGGDVVGVDGGDIFWGTVAIGEPGVSVAVVDGSGTGARVVAGVGNMLPLD